MYRIKVESSAIKEIGYHPEKEILEVLFANDTAYQYVKVGFEDYMNLIRAESIGKHFADMKESFQYARIQ
ncbi:KTSC domain-containing protein [Diaphorobacter aerolatus]|uniref:KTSC domain-containing protein n=1 Tax=Diaphorobacter aerolatus TaxID=1288495 RepID=A0A7H0GJE2_9BURK|nr:KTSC domain-containing protein [Diaphorobacter aerolatus]QNP48408.1 KTSC domain-containing protein [Diaphorobacter aerolatus]